MLFIKTYFNPGFEFSFLFLTRGQTMLYKHHANHLCKTPPWCIIEQLFHSPWWFSPSRSAGVQIKISWILIWSKSRFVTLKFYDSQNADTCIVWSCCMTHALNLNLSKSGKWLNSYLGKFEQSCSHFTLSKMNWKPVIIQTVYFIHSNKDSW